MEKSSFKHIYYRCAAQLWHLIYSSELFQETSLNLSKMIQKGADMKSTQLSSLSSSPRNNLSPSTLWGKQNHKFRHTQCPWQTHPFSLEFFLSQYTHMPQKPICFFFLSSDASGFCTSNSCFESQLAWLCVIQRYLVLDATYINLVQIG